jgi:hypothetical protein
MICGKQKTNEKNQYGLGRYGKAYLLKAKKNTSLFDTDGSWIFDLRKMEHVFI